MKKILLPLLLVSSNLLFAQKQPFVSTDIDNFWKAFDKINTTSDSLQKVQYLREYYLDKGSPGLKSLLEVRNYTEIEYLNSFKQYPKFWKSLRANSLQTRHLYPAIEKDIAGLRKIYPDLQPSTIYFLIGVFRTGGTIQQNRVLIGSELSLIDEANNISEHPSFRKKFYKDFQPKKNLPLLCTHEYIHTQQKQPLENLLSWCIYEGVAEFISCLATGKKSNTPSVAFGKANQQRVFAKFKEDLFFPNWGDWLWGENSNELKERDLGYYIGYEICERYYKQSTNKQKAIKELIELDYANEKEVERIVNSTKAFAEPLANLWDNYNKNRPTVIDISPLKSGELIKPGTIQLVINFSEEMDPEFRGFDYGPLGENHVYKFKRMIGWSNNNKTFTFEVEVNPSKRYQALVSSSFRSKRGFRLVQHLIDFETKGN